MAEQSEGHPGKGGHSQPQPTRSQHSKPSGRHISNTAGTAYGIAAFNGVLEDLREASERSHTLFRVSARSGNLLGARELFEESYVVSALLNMARTRGMEVRKALRTIERGLERGKSTPRGAPNRPRLYNRSDAMASVVEWWESVNQGEWTARTSANDLRVLAGFRAIALRRGRIRFTASHRQIAEESGVVVGTVTKAVKRGLNGYVHRVKRGSRLQGTSTEWKLITKQHAFWKQGLSPGTESNMFPNAPRSLGLPDHDEWYRWPNGWRVYTSLSFDEGLTVSDIVSITGRPPETIRRVLNKLRDKHLAIRVDGEWRALSRPENVFDGPFVRPAREERHKQDRMLWARSRAGLIDQKQVAR